LDCSLEFYWITLRGLISNAHILYRDLSMDSVNIPAFHPAQGAVIWLHGLGADGHDFAGLLPMLSFPQKAAIEWIFPHAPVRPITVNGGMEMPGWYDITSMEIARTPDAAGMAQSVAAIESLVGELEAKGFARRQIALAGFSQGGVIALLTALASERAFAGCLALSTYLPDLSMAKVCETPVLMMHGTQDPIVPYSLGMRAFAELKQAGVAIEWQAYEMQHQVCSQQIENISRWFSQIFTEKNA
jgi:phospholipase/carboxylesterase